jgi:hypothetical protein
MEKRTTLMILAGFWSLEQMEKFLMIKHLSLRQSLSVMLKGKRQKLSLKCQTLTI